MWRGKERGRERRRRVIRGRIISWIEVREREVRLRGEGREGR